MLQRNILIVVGILFLGLGLAFVYNGVKKPTPPKDTISVPIKLNGQVQAKSRQRSAKILTSGVYLSLALDRGLLGMIITGGAPFRTIYQAHLIDALFYGFLVNESTGENCYGYTY